MNKQAATIPLEVVKNCRGVLLDLGSTLLEYENAPYAELVRRSCGSAHEYLTRNSPRVPDLETFCKVFQDLLKRVIGRARNEYKEYRFNDITAQLLTSFRIPPTPEIVQGFFEHYYLKITEQVTPYRDALGTLTRLKAAGLSVCIVSNTCFPAKVHRAELARFGLLKHIDAAVFSSDLGVRKPHRDIYLAALKKVGREIDEVVFAGDRQLEDVLGPQMVGIAAVLVRRPHRDYEPGLTSCPEVDNIGALPGLLEL